MIKWWLKEIGDLNCDINEWFSMVDGDLVAYLEWKLQIWKQNWLELLNSGSFWLVLDGHLYLRSPFFISPGEAAPELEPVGTLAPGSNVGVIASGQKAMAVKESPISSRQSFACPFFAARSFLRHKWCLLPCWLLFLALKSTNKTHIFLTNFRFVWWAASTVFACFCYFLFFVWTHLFPDSISLSPHFQCLNIMVFPWFPQKTLLTNQFSFPKIQPFPRFFSPFSSFFPRSSRTETPPRAPRVGSPQEGPVGGGHRHQHRGHPGASVAAADHQGGGQRDETRQRALDDDGTMGPWGWDGKN